MCRNFESYDKPSNKTEPKQTVDKGNKHVQNNVIME